ncbi:hypothetical protein NLI96_g7164 [Meripilus lineatus]|uniref:Uncharacterized protein n=1 Tax=Meripilus lineatus TaxID=2056292 RepID=A0AAD5YF95_9APHY|nr:hypothetical protein NLI96_g7164 [Physisporinus lineatus]
MSTPFEPVDIMAPVQWRIPLEVVEKIIDSAGQINFDPVRNENIDETYSMLCALASVCRALVPRSRICLFRAVTLTSDERASKFLATISNDPAFGKLVYILRIDCKGDQQGKYGWIYEGLKILPSHLTNLNELQYMDLPVLHPLFHVLSPKFSTVRSLIIEGSNQTFRETVQIVNGFKNLERLTFSYLNI